MADAGFLNPKEAVPKAEAVARKALELDEGLSEAHYAAAKIKRSAWDWAGAEQAFKRSIELSPSSARAHSGYSGFLDRMGRHDQAISEAKRARELDPLNLNWSSNLGYALYFARRYDQAVEQLKKVLEIDRSHATTHVILAYTYNSMGKYNEAIAEFEEAKKLRGETTSDQCFLGYALAKAARRAEAETILTRLETTKEYVSPAELAILYIALGKKEQALSALERAYGVHDLQMQYLKIDPHYDELRSEPRFQELIRKVGLPQ